ncbi:MAG: hypothetical protein ACRDCC_11290, partial [Culicoidibacterales bacterium]
FDNPLEECSASELLAMSFFKIQPVENREFACLDLATIVEKKQLLEAEQAEAERQRLEAEQAAEVERQRLEAEQAAEAERQRLEAEQAAEAERQRLEAEQAAEVERQRLEAEQAAQAERQRLEEEQAAEVERQRVEAREGASATNQRFTSFQTFTTNGQPERILVINSNEESTIFGEKINQSIELTEKSETRYQKSPLENVKVKSLEQLISQTTNRSEFNHYTSLAKTAEEQLAILRHPLATKSCIEQLINNQPEDYIMKVIFGHEHSDAEIMKVVLQQVSAQALFKMYTIYELRKIVQATTSRERLEQYTRIALDKHVHHVILQHSLVTERCIEILLQNQPEIEILKLICTHTVTPEPLRKSLKVQYKQEIERLNKNGEVTSENEEARYLVQSQYVQKSLLDQIQQVQNNIQLQEYSSKAKTAEEQLAILRHQLVTMSCIEQILKNKPETYILKVIFGHERSDAAIMALILRVELPSTIYSLYAEHELKKAILAETDSSRLQQYARIAYDSEIQLVVLRHPKVTSECIQILMEHKPEIGVSNLIQAHAVTPATIRPQPVVPTQPQIDPQPVREVAQPDFSTRLQEVTTHDQLVTCIEMATTPEMQLAIIRHPKNNAIILELLAEHSQELAILRTILTHSRTEAQTIKLIFAKLTETEQQQVIAAIPPVAFERFVALVDSTAELSVYVQFANTANKQLAILQSKYLTPELLDSLQAIATEKYIMSQITKMRAKLANPVVQVLAPETPKVAPRASNRFSKESQQSEYQPEANSQQSAIKTTAKVRRIESATTSDELLPFLAENNLTLNIAIAKSPLATEAILERLIDLKNEQVNSYINKNKQLTDRLRTKMNNLKQQQKVKQQQSYKKQNPHEFIKSLDFLGKLNIAKSQDMEVAKYFPILALEKRNEIRQALVDNPKVANDTLRILATDRIPPIARRAIQRLAGN